MYTHVYTDRTCFYNKQYDHINLKATIEDK